MQLTQNTKILQHPNKRNIRLSEQQPYKGGTHSCFLIFFFFFEFPKLDINEKNIATCTGPTFPQANREPKIKGKTENSISGKPDTCRANTN